MFREIPADAKIIIPVKKGAPSERVWTWSQFTDRFAPQLRRFMRNLLGPESVNDSFVIETLSGFFVAPPRFVYSSSERPFGMFLLACVLQDMRSTAAVKSDAWALPIDRFHAGTLRIDEAWDDAWQQELLASAVRSVRREESNSESFRIFELCTLRGFSLEEVGQQMRIPQSSVLKARERIGRILRQRKQEIEERGE